MTVQLRQTFSESWYRVKDLKVKLRASAQISRQFYRGERWYVVRDPAGNQYHRLSDPAYKFVGLLDGSRTVAQAWDTAGGNLEDDAPTQPEVIQILSHLYSANLIDADVTPDASILLRRHKQLSKRKMQSRVMNMLFPRIPIWDPDQFLTRWMPVARILFSKFGALVWLVVIGTAIAVLAPHWKGDSQSLTEAAKHAVDIKYNTINIFYIWLVFCFVKLIHELGHAFACRRFGGECHELGIMFLVFVPTPYVDASSAWSFQNKWHRIFVGCAGMIVELFFAALCGFIWVNAGNPTGLVAQLAFNAMLVASVTTVLFNANPLLRYDGYYILSDFLEIPNLRQKSSEYAMGLIKRHVFRIKSPLPLPSPLQRFWLLLYAVASSMYRIFVGVLIILMVAFQIPILGMLMAIGGVATWLIVPIGKLGKYLMLDNELHRKRGRAFAFCLAVAAVIVTLVGFIPFPLNIDQPGITEAAMHEGLYAQVPGFVTQIVAHDGDLLKENDVIMVTTDRELETKLQQMEADIVYWQRKMSADRVSAPEQIGVDRAQMGMLEKQLKERKDEEQKLIIRAPIAGRLVAPELHNMIGRFMAHNTEIGTIQEDSSLNVRVMLEQENSQLITRLMDAKDPAVRAKLKTQIRLASAIDDILEGGTLHAVGGGDYTSIHPSLTQLGGNDAPPDPKDPKKTRTEQFEIDVPVANPNEKYVIGQTAHVRFKLGKEPVIHRWYRRILQVLQTRPSSPLV